MATLYEDQMRLAREDALYDIEHRKLLRRSMWISIFMGVTVSTALLTYAWVNQENISFDYTLLKAPNTVRSIPESRTLGYAPLLPEGVSLQSVQSTGASTSETARRLI